MDPNQGQTQTTIQPPMQPVMQVESPPPTDDSEKKGPPMKIFFVVFALVSIIVIGGVVFLTTLDHASKAATPQPSIPQVTTAPIVTGQPTAASQMEATPSSSEESAVDKIMIDDGSSDIKSLQQDAAGL